MFLPYADQSPEEGRTPWVNWLLIGANVYFFIELSSLENYGQIIDKWGCTPAHFRPITLLTSLFLHGDIWHLMGNMWFLFVFGKSVESRIGPLRFLVVYGLAGVAGDISHVLFFWESRIPTIGASGAIYGVLGMYLVLFPYNRIKVIYFFVIFLGRAVISAVWVIGLFFLIELFYSRMQTTSGLEDGVGHLAHSGGFIAGALAALFMASTGMLEGRRRDILAHLSKHVDTEFEFERDMDLSIAKHDTMNPSDATSSSLASATAMEPSVDAWAYTLGKEDPRYEIVWSLQHQRIDAALAMWREFAFSNLDAVLPVREQLQLAHELDKSGAIVLARNAYERLLAYYKNHQPYTAEAQLSLAGMLLQHWQESSDASHLPLARKLLHLVVISHPDAVRRELAQRWLIMARPTS
jgi:membrane associated rhomboid family serine protease